ncbi:MAG: PadR family transcriptional regulator [Candidatus Hydrogenedens sp.]|nr:PadR family transcriptional regulator [Candidatus Hydrogenedens sp.]
MTPADEPPDELGNWMTQLRKGLLELCIFNLLAQGELYGYDLVKRLSKVPGLVISEGTVYPLLSRLRKGGLLETRLVESASGPARRYYRLSPEGERILRLMNQYWHDLAAGVDGYIKGERDDA